MTLPRRRLLQIVAGLAVLPSLPRQASADVYPSRPVHVVVGFAPAGGADVLARILGKRLAEVLGQQVIVENVTGAGGMVGASRVARSEPNGYQIFVGSTADAINVSLYKRPLYDLRADLMPVVLIADQPAVLLARSDFPASNLQEFIAYIKKNEDSIKFASAGVGSSNHLDCVRFNAATGVNVTHVPYRGGGAAMQDLIAGRVDYICTLSAADSGTIVAPPERRSIEFLRQHVESEIERNAIPIRAIGLSIE